MKEKPSKFALMREGRVRAKVWAGSLDKIREREERTRRDIDRLEYINKLDAERWQNDARYDLDFVEPLPTKNARWWNK